MEPETLDDTGQDAAPVPGGDAGMLGGPWLVVAPSMPNLAGYASAEQLAELARVVCDEYQIDEESQADWRKALDKAKDLVSFLGSEEKNYPWKGAADIRYPLVTTACMKFNAQAYPAIVPPGDIVKTTVHGRDDSGAKAARGMRVAAYMSHQLRKEVDNWEPDTDRLLMQLPFVGQMYRKTWPDPASGKVCSRLCKPGAVVVNNAVATMEAAPRVSEKLSFYPVEIIERQRGGLFVAGDWAGQGRETTDTLAPVEVIEQCRRFDLDGDGYPEPYVVTVHEPSKTVVRIAANWDADTVRVSDDGQVVSIAPTSYYASYPFVPDPMGGFSGIGLGVLLGDISATVNAALNMISDAAHMQALGSGFIGAEARLKGGDQTFRPGQYKQVQATGQDLRAAIVERPTPGPSPVLFQLLGLLIDAAREIANVQNIQDQAGRSNQPATTTVALIEQGMAIYTAIFKRIHRALRGEFHQIAKANMVVVDPQRYAAFHEEQHDPRADFDLSDMDIEPVADPRAVSAPQRLAQGELVMQLAQQGLVDKGEATKRILAAASVPDLEALAPKGDPAAQAKMAELEEQQRAMVEAQARAAQLANVAKGVEISEREAKIAKTMAETTHLLAQAEAADMANPVAVAAGQAERLIDDASVRDDAGDVGRMAVAPGNGGGIGGVGAGGGNPAPVGLGQLLGDGAGEPAGIGAGPGLGGVGG